MFEKGVDWDQILFSLNKEGEGAVALVEEEEQQEGLSMQVNPMTYTCQQVPSLGCDGVAVLNSRTRTVVSCFSGPGAYNSCQDAREALLESLEAMEASSSGSEGGCEQDPENGSRWTGSGCPEYDVPTSCPPISPPANWNGPLVNGMIQMVLMAYQTNRVPGNPAGCKRLKCVQPAGLAGTSAVFGSNLVDQTGGEFCCGVEYYRNGDGDLVMFCP